MDAFTYRELPASEWGRVVPIFDAYGALLPSTELSHIFVAESETDIEAFLTLQYVPHMEPLWVKEEQRGRVSLVKLAAMAEGYLGNGVYYVSSPDKRVQKLYKKHGLRPVDGMWQKELKK